MGKVIMSGIVPNMTKPISGILASDLAVGSSVYLMEDGVAVEYLVVNQGKPSGSSLYDDSCDGLWLLRKDCIKAMFWDDSDSNILESSDIQSYLNADMFSKYDADVQNAIKQVKIPYRKNGGSTGTTVNSSDGLLCKVFLLSGYEVGWTTSNDNYFPVDGAVLDYFNGTSETDSKRISKMNGKAQDWWIRSQSIRGTTGVFYVGSNGSHYTSAPNYMKRGVRPALVLPPNALFDKDTLILKGVA